MPDRRRYPQQDVKLLFMLSAGYCAFPGCKRICREMETAEDAPVVVGEISHIVAHGDAGPRADATMPAAERDRYANWVLFCPTHLGIPSLAGRTHHPEIAD